MKIALFLSTFPNTSETFVLNQITGLLDRGHEVTIFSEARPRLTTTHDAVNHYQLQERTHYYTIEKKDNVKRAYNVITQLIRHVPRNPLRVLGTYNPFRHGAKALRSKIFHEYAFWQDQPYSDFDIIYAHFGPNGVIAEDLRNRGLITGKLITVFHAYDLTKYVERKGRANYEHLFSRGDLFLAITEYARQKLIGLGCPDEKIAIHHMGVDCTQFNFQPFQHLPSTPMHLVSVGRMVEKKGFQYGIEAIAKAKAKGHDVHLTVIGDGPLHTDLDERVHEWGIENAVTFLGWQTQEQIAPVLKQSHVLLCPSITASTGDEEGLPVVLMEALAAGLPVITTHHAGIPELIRDGDTGYMVAERDSDALAEKIELLYLSDTMGRHLSHQGRAVIEHEFNIETLNDELVSLFQSIL